MKRHIYVAIMFISANGCADNDILAALAKEDQAARPGKKIEQIVRTDKDRRIMVFSLLASGQVDSPVDKMRAGLILHHTELDVNNEQLVSKSPENYLLAHFLFKEAYNDGLEKAAFLVAASIDRYLGHTKGCQKYGTNLVVNMETGEMELVPIDRTVADTERAKYDVPPLGELLSKYPEQEQKTPSEKCEVH